MKHWNAMAATLLPEMISLRRSIHSEPELGLHPNAISVIASLVKSASVESQVIIATQSPTFLDYFEPHNVITANRSVGKSKFERLEAEELRDWLEDYSLGELWQKNVVRGGPVRD